MTKRRRETNEQLVIRLMRFSRNGALMQVFVLTALQRYAELVKDAKPEEVQSAMIPAEAWKRVADELLEEIERHYKQDH